MKRIIYIALFLLLFIITLSLKAQNEHGILPMRVYGTSDYSGQQQIFDVKADSRGIIYASNRSGLLELSGNTWKAYKIRNEVQVRAIDIDSSGRIFVGGDGEFGYFAVDSGGAGVLIYHSISKLISNEKNLDFGSIKTIICNGGITYFHCANTIFLWDFDSLKTYSSENRFIDLFTISNQVVTTVDKKGYFSVGNDSLRNIYKSSASGISLFAVPYNATSNLVYSSNSGVRFASINNNNLRFGKKIHTFFDRQKDIKVLNLLKISGNLFSVATNKGIYIINIEGKLIRIINKQHGLKSNIINSQSIDRNNTLWIGTENGMAKINILSSSEFFPPKSCNYSGRIEDIIRFNGVINIITPSGFYQLDKNIKSLDYELRNFSTVGQHALSKFTRLNNYIKSSAKANTIKDTIFDELNNPCWDFEIFELNNKRQLLISSNNFLISLDSIGTPSKVIDCYPYCSYQSKVNPRRVFIGLDGGLQSVYLTKDNKWVNEGLVKGIDEIVIDIKEDNDGNLWLATNIQGIVYIEHPNFQDHTIINPNISSLKKGLLSIDPLRIQSINDKLYFASSYGIYTFSWKDSTFTIDTSFGQETSGSNTFNHRLSKDYQGLLWDVTINAESKIANVYCLQRNENGTYKTSNVFAKKDEIINSFEHDQNGDTWFGGTFGLSKTTIERLLEEKVHFYTYITTVLNNNDTTYGGYYSTENGVSLNQPESFIKTFDFQHNSFTFYFSSSSPIDFDNLKYSWYLEGYEHELNWGPWSDKTYKEYTNLNEGTYVFHVRSVDIYGNLSQVSTYQFQVNPPWYRTIWAFFGYFIFFVAFVWIAIRISTRSLKRIIKAATAEIMEQKDLLEEKNQNIIDSIRYAQRIQEAVIPSSALFHQSFKDSFVLWKPRDIVSGDFYWLAPRNNQLFVAAADCTGHGVPGAFMSIMGISFLNQIVGSPEIKNAADTLNKLRHHVITALNKEQDSTTTNKDGMDIALCVFDFDKKQVEYAGAYNSLYIYRDGVLLETKANRMPIGVHDRDNIPFKNNIIDIETGDQIYMFSDGYIDQFGGPKGKKFMTKRFKKLLLEINHLSMDEQKERLWNNILDWRGSIEQVDDIIIIGIRIE